MEREWTLQLLPRGQLGAPSLVGSATGHDCIGWDLGCTGPPPAGSRQEPCPHLTQLLWPGPWCSLNPCSLS